MAAKKPWADGPFELIPFSRLGYKKGDTVRGVHKMGEEMIIVHNFVLRGINSIYLQCVNVERSPADVAPFVAFARYWGELVHVHHDTEETWIFPDIARLSGEPAIMEGSVEQHHAFHAGLDGFDAYLADVQAGKAAYDGKRTRALIDAFMPALRQHLDDEIGVLRSLERYEAKTDWGRWHRDTQARIMKKTMTPEIKYTTMPLAITCHETAFEDRVFAWFPPLPWFVWLLYKWFFYPKHKNSWKFAPCDLNGVRQELPFA